MSQTKIFIAIVIIIILIVAVGFVLWKFFQPDIPYLPGTAHEAAAIIEDGNAGE